MTNKPETKEKKQPMQVIYFTTIEPGTNKTHWLEVGAVWPTKNPKVSKLKLKHAISPTGDYILCTNEPKE